MGGRKKTKQKQSSEKKYFIEFLFLL